MDGNSVILGALADGDIITSPETGEIFSYRVRCRVGQKTLLKGSVCNGYIVHKLSFRGIKRQIRAHRVVWMSVNGAIPEGLMIDHINRVRTDNSIGNLRLVTSAGNAENTELRTGESNSAAKISRAEAEEICQRFALGESCRSIAKDFDIGKSQVHNIVTGSTYWMDGPFGSWFRGWPAGPQEAQKEWEPARLAVGVPDRQARLKALGNCVVPQQAYPFFAMIAARIAEGER